MGRAEAWAVQLEKEELAAVWRLSVVSLGRRGSGEQTKTRLSATLVAAALLCPLLGCDESSQEIARGSMPLVEVTSFGSTQGGGLRSNQVAVAPRALDTALQPDRVSVAPRSHGSSLHSDRVSVAHVSTIVERSDLGAVAHALQIEAKKRSTALQDLRSARAVRHALQFEKYPKLAPSVSFPVGGGNPSIGVGVKQTIWDFGGTHARIASADLDIEQALVRVWAESNEAVFKGLDAYLDISRLGLRIEELEDVRRKLIALQELLQARASGGVADRGEGLRMTAALQEIQRELIQDEASLRESEARLARLLPVSTHLSSLENLTVARQMCRRKWPGVNTPEVILARLDVAQARASESLAKSQRFPRILAEAGKSYALSGSSNTTVGLTIDASDMLGLGARSRLRAAEARTKGAIQYYRNVQDTVLADVAQLQYEYSGQIESEKQLEGLVKSGAETLQVYQDQVDAGSISLTEGIRIIRENMSARLSLIDLQRNIAVNCLRISRIKGTLSKFGTEVAND